MKTAILAAALALATITANAQTPTPGYDRPSTTREHQHVVYFNDSLDHYDIDLQVAADAFSTNDLYDKRDSRAKNPDSRAKNPDSHEKRNGK